MERTIEIDGVLMTPEAAKRVEECGVDVAADLEDAREGRTSRTKLLDDCLNGSDPDRESGWREYVDAVWTAASFPVIR